LTEKIVFRGKHDCFMFLWNDSMRGDVSYKVKVWASQPSTENANIYIYFLLSLISIFKNSVLAGRLFPLLVSGDAKFHWRTEEGRGSSNSMETSILLHCSNSILIKGVGYYISVNCKKAVQNDRSCTLWF